MCTTRIAAAMVCCSLAAPTGLPSLSRHSNPVRTQQIVSLDPLVSLINFQRSSSNQSRQQEIQRARRLLESGSIDQAIAVLREIVRKTPNDADAHLLLGTALTLVPQRSEALEELRRAIELRPSFAPAYHALGTALARFAELDHAIQMFRKALELDQNLAETHVSLALLFAQRKESASAREHLVRAIEIQGDSRASAYSRYVLAQVLMELKDFERAQREIKAAIRLRPSFADAHLTLGLLKKQLVKSREALEAFRRAVELAPNHPVANYELGVAYLRCGKAAEAIAPLQKAFESKSSSRQVLYQLCQALRRAGRAEESEECHEKLAATVDAKVAAELGMVSGALNNEGIQLEEAGDLAGALEKYRSAVEIDPFEPTLRRNLALVLCRLGRWDDGIAELREVLRINPEDVEATKALYIALEQAGAARRSSPKSGKRKPERK